MLDTDTEVLIYDTLRTKQQQEENVQNGVSQTMRSYHLVGQALDFVPVVDSKGSVDWNGYARAEIRRAIERAKNLGFTWGGDWTSFADQPHLQYDGIGMGLTPLTAEIQFQRHRIPPSSGKSRRH
ncbi:MAG: M15 family metallopeptidase [Clostridia bacterium]